MEEKKPKFEYSHYVLFPGIHLGIHSVFGEHVALGVGRNSVHLYKNRIFLGDGTEFKLSPSQTMMVSRILSRIAQKVDEKQLLERINGEKTAEKPEKSDMSENSGEQKEVSS